MHLMTSKNFKMSFKNSTRKNDALLAIVTICQNESKKLPKLVNIDLKKITKNASIDLKKNQDNQQVNKISAKKIEKIVPDLDLNQILSNFNWDASGDASALEKTLQEEVQALEAVMILL